MSQKDNPDGSRVGVKKDGDSSWFKNKKEKGDNRGED